MGNKVDGRQRIWILQSAVGVRYVLSLLKLLKKILMGNAGGLSPAVPENVVPTISTLSPTTGLILQVVRTDETSDAGFGKAIIGNELICYTMERLAVRIPEGSYPAYKRYSAHLCRTVIGIDVPNRTDIEIHNANLPGQLLGCIATGLSVDGDALDNSIAALEKLLSLVPESFTVLVRSEHK